MTILALIGLGRIGAFHAETLTNLPELSGLVITDERPDLVQGVAAKNGATPADSIEHLLSPVSTASWSRRPPQNPCAGASR